MRPVRAFWLGLLSLVLLAGCNSITRYEQAVAAQSIEIASGHTVGQTFVTRYSGLTAIDVYLQPKKVKSTLLLTLFADPLRQDPPLATAEVHLGEEDGDGLYRFSFAPIDADRRQDYYFSLEVIGDANLGFATAPGDTYLDGALYLDHQPENSQLVFRLAYDFPRLALGIFLEGMSWLKWVLLAFVLYSLPGWALLSFILDRVWKQRHWSEKLALSTGAGLSLYPVIFLLASLAGLRLGWPFFGVLTLLASVSLVWKNRKGFNWPRFSWPRHLSEDLAADLAFIALLVLIFVTRFWTIRNTEFPLWGDSYHHTMIAQLMFDNGGLFKSWLPYVPYETLTVQYGFSGNVAVWMAVTGLQSPQATLIFGQLLNGMAVLGLYPLALLISRGNRWAGVASLLLGGLISLHPAFYANWGRYAQLAGQAILPVALSLIWYWLEDTDYDWKQAVISAVVISGMLLSYYRMAFYYVTFLPVLLGLFALHGSFRWNSREWLRVLLKLVVVGGLCLILLSPWVLNTAGGTLSENVGEGMARQSPVQAVLTDYKIWQTYSQYITNEMLILAVIGLLTSLIFRRAEVAGVWLWLILISAVKAGSLLRLPGANMMGSFIVLISLYIFAALTGGWLLGRLFQWMVARQHTVGIWLSLAIIAIFSVFGAVHNRGVVDLRTYSIVTSADQRAMEWIRDHTPPDALFLVEGFRINNGTSAVGSDAGWWLPLSTSRKNTMPPQYALLAERSNPPDYSQRVVDLIDQLEGKSPVDATAWKVLCNWGVTNIYVCQQQGLVGLEKKQLFPSDLPTTGKSLQLVYKQDRVRIYALNRDSCPPSQ